MQQEKEYFGSEDMMEKIDEEFKLEVIEERHEEEHGIEHYLESESEDDRELFHRMFDG